MTPTTDDAFIYRDAKRASVVVDAARETMTPEQIAVDLGVSVSSLSKWKKDVGVISAATARKVRRLARRIGK
jgi:hypothetical protein